MKLNEYILFLLTVLSFVSCGGNTEKKGGEYKNFQGEIFGTYYHISYSEGKTANVTQAGLDSVFAAVNNSLSVYVPTSTISKINQNVDSVMLDSLFIKVYQTAQYVSTETGGAFDMTVAPLVNLWGFGFEHSDSITKEMIDSIMPTIGFHKLHLVDGKIVKENPKTMLDASAIAKGFSSDCVADYLRACGSENFMVEIGGEIVVQGTNPKGEKWSIGVTKPYEGNSVDQPDMQAVIRLTDCGMATSGNYRRFYHVDGMKISHTINPATGYPVNHSLLSATVIMSDCMTADAFATSFMVVGLDSAMSIASKHPEMSTYFIYADSVDNQLHTIGTGRFNEMVVEECK